MIAKAARQLLRGFRHGRRVDLGVRILTYHGVVESRTDARVDESFHLLRDFRAHLEILKWCRVVALDELEQTLTSPSLRPRVAITFDDGFRNNSQAAELLHAAKLPATFFIATDNIERGQPIWPTLLRLILARGSARVLELGSARYELDSDLAAISNVRKHFKQAAADRRELLWTELKSQLRSGEVEELVSQFPSIAMMSWSEVSALSANGFEIASHGAWHELHHDNQPLTTRTRELVRSKEQIESKLKSPCLRFAYPNGTFTDTSPSDLRGAGYVAGFTMVSRAAKRNDDPMLLPRIVPGAHGEKMISALFFGN